MLAERTREDLRAEIADVACCLIERHGMTARGVRQVTRAAARTGKVRPQPPCSGMRVANADDLVYDLEDAVVELGNSRSSMAAVGRGIRAVIPA